MAAALNKSFDSIDVQFLKSGGGVFEVNANENLVFSKKALGRFPSNDEVINSIKAL